MRELPADPSHRYFARLDSSFWQAMVRLLAETISWYANDTGRDPRAAITRYWDKVFDAAPAPELLLLEIWRRGALRRR